MRETVFIFISVFHVKRFHVKRFVKVNKTISLTYTKFPKDHVEQVFHVDPTEQPSQRTRCDPQIFCGQLLAFFEHAYAPLQRRCCLLQKFALPLPADQSALA